MSLRIASVHFYDCLENVSVSAKVRAYDSYEGGQPTDELQLQSSFKGEGVDDPREWLRDALVALLEAL